MNHAEKKSALFLKTFAGVFLGTFFLVVSFNYVSDSYLIFHQQPTVFQVSFLPNTRFLKTNYLSGNCGRFDAIIFGNSRAVAYLTKDIDQQFGVRSYNFSAPEETYLGILQKLEWLASENCMPKIVFLPVSSESVLSLSDDTPNPYSTRKGRFHLNLVLMEHPRIVKKIFYWRDFFVAYLASKTVTKVNGKRLLNSYEAVPIKYDMSSGDVFYLWDLEFPISKCPKNYRTPPGEIEPGYIFQPAKVAARLTKIKKFTEEKGSQTVLIWNPLPPDQQIKDLDKTEILLKNLSHNFQNLYRLPLNEEKLRDNAHYHDPVHFKSSMAKEVVVQKNKTPTLGLLEELKKHQATCQLRD